MKLPTKIIREINVLKLFNEDEPEYINHRYTLCKEYIQSLFDICDYRSLNNFKEESFKSFLLKFKNSGGPFLQFFIGTNSYSILVNIYIYNGICSKYIINKYEFNYLFKEVFNMYKCKMKLKYNYESTSISCSYLN